MFDNIDNMALDSAVAFAKAEFGTSVKVERFDEKIPNTRAPYHVTFLVKVDASKRVREGLLAYAVAHGEKAEEERIRAKLMKMVEGL